MGMLFMLQPWAFGLPSLILLAKLVLTSLEGDCHLGSSPWQYLWSILWHLHRLSFDLNVGFCLQALRQLAFNTQWLQVAPANKLDVIILLVYRMIFAFWGINALGSPIGELATWWSSDCVLNLWHDFRRAGDFKDWLILSLMMALVHQSDELRISGYGGGGNWSWLWWYLIPIFVWSKIKLQVAHWSSWWDLSAGRQWNANSFLEIYFLDIYNWGTITIIDGDS